MKQDKKHVGTQPSRNKQKKEQAAIAYWQAATCSIASYQWSDSTIKYYWNDYIFVPNKSSK